MNRDRAAQLPSARFASSRQAEGAARRLLHARAHLFVKLIGHPQVMRVCTRYGLPRRTLMQFTLKLLANLTDAKDGDAMDRLVNASVRIAPAA